MKDFFKLNLFILIINLIFFQYSVNSQEPKSFIEGIANEASKILSSDLSKLEKASELQSIAKKNVDINGIGLYTLGSHRKNLSDSKKKEYLDLFNKYFLKSFSSRLAEYSDPKINVLSQEKLSEKYTIVSSVLLATDKRPEVKIDWRVYTKNKDKPLIRDLIIEGLSLARTQKEEFNSVITSSDNGIEGLFSNLKNFIEN
jgi:phospholipid transport system substrate-binding protein